MSDLFGTPKETARAVLAGMIADQEAVWAREREAAEIKTLCGLPLDQRLERFHADGGIYKKRGEATGIDLEARVIASLPSMAERQAHVGLLRRTFGENAPLTLKLERRVREVYAECRNVRQGLPQPSVKP